MGTIEQRRRKNGTIGYTARIVIKRGGKVIHREAQTYDRRPAARAWLDKREGELAEPGAIERAKSDAITLSDAIDRYTTESLKEIGRTKTQVLEAIKRHDIAAKPCDRIESSDIVALARDLSADKQPQTISNYLSHLASVFSIARPAWGYPLDRQAMEDALAVTKRLGLTGKSKHRDRRPTLAELDVLLSFFMDRHKRRPASAPMHLIVPFALFSTRRLEEITRIRWADLDRKHNRVLVRDMKNPGEKIGNDVWCDLPPEAMTIIDAMPETGECIFPYTPVAISARFTKACLFLTIDDLHLHDMRHEGVSRLFELGNSIPHVAAVSGHRSWTSLKRYTHLREVGDKYAGWKWLKIVTQQPPHIRQRPTRKPSPVLDCAET